MAAGSTYKIVEIVSETLVAFFRISWSFIKAASGGDMW